MFGWGCVTNKLVLSCPHSIISEPRAMDFRPLIIKHFPFPEFNAGQYEAIEKILIALTSGVTHVIAEMPTGIGKSVTIYTVSKVMQELNSSYRTTIITGTTGLQDQYTQDFPEIYDLRGKTRYPCSKGVGPYNSVGCRQAVAQGKCFKAMQCDYFMTRTKWCNEAKIRITNTSFQIEACPQIVMMPENKASLIAIDECHELPNHLISHSTLKIVAGDLFHTKRIMGEAFVGHVIDVIDSYINIPVGSAFKPSKEQRKTMSELKTIVDAAIDSLEPQMKDPKAGNKSSVGGAIEELQQVGDKIDLYVSLENGEWILTEFEINKKIELKPVYAFQVSNHGIFRKAKQFVHMSATICGFEEYRKSLGITDSYVEISIGNPIPVENRPVKLVSNVQVSGNFDRAKVAATIDKIIERHGNENGVVHTVSFKLAEEIRQHSKYKSRMTISNDRKEIMRLLSKKDSGNIILSPSITTGYDFKGDMARWGVIAKIPFLYIGDTHVKLNMSRNGRWYAREAILKLVQSCGRIVRGPSDHGVNYVIDSNVNRLIRDNHDMFPEWFLESLIVRSKK